MDNVTRERALKWAKEHAEKPAVAKHVIAIKEEIVNAVPVVSNSKLEEAKRIAVKIIKNFEGCSLRVYPDPASELSRELSKHGILLKYIAGDLVLPPYLAKLSGAPLTCGYGETQGVTKDTVWTLEEANNRLEARIGEFMGCVLKVSPELSTQNSEKLAAVTSLCYNIGVSAYKTSTVAKCIARSDFTSAAESFLLWNRAGGKVLQGLVTRRKIESEVFSSVKG